MLCDVPSWSENAAGVDWLRRQTLCAIGACLSVFLFVVFLIAPASAEEPHRHGQNDDRSIGGPVESSPCDWERWQAKIDEFVAQDRAVRDGALRDGASRKNTTPGANGTDGVIGETDGGVVFVGSSSIRMWDLRASFPDLPTLNRGFGGSQICDSVHFFAQLILPHMPRVVVFYAGDNDVAAGKTAEQVQIDFRAFVRKLHGSLPETRLVYIAIKPSVARWGLALTMADANRRIAADCAANEQCTFVDVWGPMLNKQGTPNSELFLDDGLHLNAQGYALWASLVGQHLPGDGR